MLKTEFEINNSIHNSKIVSNISSTSKISILEYYPQYWAESREPLEKESLSSWMIRIASANLEKISSLTGEEGYYPSYIDLDINWIPELMQIFAEKTKISEKRLRNLSLVDIKENLDKNLLINKSESLIVKDLLFTGWRKRSQNGLRFCPRCLKQDEIPFFRKIWRIGYIPVCLVHDCFLENKCPKCNVPIIPYLINWDSDLRHCYKCGFDLSLTELKLIQKDDPLLLAFKNFFKTNEFNQKFKIIILAWFLANHCSFSDQVFENHPLTKSEALIELEQKALKFPNKKFLLVNLNIIFLLFGTAIQLYQNKKQLNEFLHSNHTSINLVWTKKPFSCPHKNCKFSESNFSRMQIHLRRHNNERLFTCDICNTNFLTKWDLDCHKNLHGLPHPFKCSFNNCYKEFRYQKQFIQHLRSAHKIKPYTCEICNQSFNRNTELITHIRTHTGEKPYQCDICGKFFAQKSALNVHLRTHTKEKHHICKICGKSFTQSHSLTEHLRIHNDERPYFCPECGKRFKRKHHLDIHLRTHSGEKPFVCENCGKSFSDKGNLKKHMMFHSDKRPYICNICGKSYKYSSGLSKHKKKEH